MNMFRQQGKNRYLGKQNKSRRSNRAEHRRFFLEAEQRSRVDPARRQDQLQGRSGRLLEITFASQHWPEVGKELRGKQWRSFKRAGHKRREPQSQIRVTAILKMRKTGCLDD